VVFGRIRTATSFTSALLFPLQVAAHSSCTEDPTDDHADEKHTWNEDDVLDGGHGFRRSLYRKHERAEVMSEPLLPLPLVPFPEELKAGDVIDGKYQVERELGIGGMGRVMLALHLGLEERVALKMLLPEATRDPEAVARFAREAKAAARIKSEHVARVLDVSALGGKNPYIVMEYLEGSDLEQVVEAGGPLAVDDAVDYVLQACEALAEAHARGVIHRDLKPGNLHLSRRADGSPMVKVLDFGISKIRTHADRGSMTTTSALLGSPLYMSPEQMKATRDVDARSDIWAMGVVLYELLTARSPFQAPSMPQVCARVLDTAPDSLAPNGLPTGLEAVVMKCLEKKPDLRFADVAGLATALQPFAPERSEISIERILKVLGTPISNNLTISTGGAFLPRGVSPSAPTLSEDEISRSHQRETMPMPAMPPTIPKVGSETMTNATLSAHNFLTTRKQRRTASYGAAGVLIGGLILVGARSYSRASDVAESSSAPASSAVLTAAAVTTGHAADPEKKDIPVSVAAPHTSSVAPPPVEPNTANVGNATKTEVTAAPSASPIASATSSTHGRKRNQDLSKLFGGRD
jgi:eukaryotic-like serine/threonine-protein kinase